MKMPQIAHKELSARQREMEEIFLRPNVIWSDADCLWNYLLVLFGWFCLCFNNESEFWTSLFLGDARKFIRCLLFFLVSKAMLSHFFQDHYGM